MTSNRTGAMRAVAAVLFLMQLAGCRSWRPYGLEPGQTRIPGTVRLTLTTDEQLEMRDPFVVGDSAIAGRQDAAGPVWTIPLTDVRSLEERRFDPGRTAALLIGVTIVGAVVIPLAVELAICYGGSGC